jgi:hypothetical protein
MPTAQEFFASGRGNGFPSCLSKENVSTYDNVEAMTLQEAIKIFWNLASITYSASSSGNDLSISISGTSTAPEEPKDRICDTVSFPEESYSEETTSPDFDPIYAAVSFRFESIEIKRLYNGAITDEENFIGYGIELLCSVSAEYVNEFNGQVVKRVSIHSYVDDDPDSTITTVSIGGVTFLEKNVDIVEGNIAPDNATVVAELTSFDFYT